jgi:hypothetical protein
VPFQTNHAALRSARVEGADAREAWAREHGCDSFEQAMALGLASVARGAEKHIIHMPKTRVKRPMKDKSLSPTLKSVDLVPRRMATLREADKAP